MPVTTYTHYTDPETGEVTLVPQLFPHACAGEVITPNDLEEWVKEGIIPQEVYEEHKRSFEESFERFQRVQNGESISDLGPPTTSPIELTQFMLKNKASLYGESVLEKIFSHLSPQDPDVVWLSKVKEAITSIASKDPLPIHFAAARKYLTKIKVEDSAAVDLLARELVNQCGEILKLKTLNHPIFKKISLTPQDLNTEFVDENGEMLSLDAEFIDNLKKMGKKGKDAAKRLSKECKEIYGVYKEHKSDPNDKLPLWSLWVVDPNESDPISPSLYLLAKLSWESHCAPIWNRQAKQHPAITKPITEYVKPLLNPKEKKKFVQQDENLVCVGDQGKPLIMAPAIDSGMIELIKKGVKNFSTLTGHRLLRWEIITGYEQWARGEADFRKIKIKGGYSQIADAAGCPSTHEIAKVKSILHAQAYGRYTYQDGSAGNMLSLRILENYKNNEPSKINIVLGDMLLPGYVHNISNKRERLLIPIGDLPPLYGSKNTHANQAHLQLLVFEEFSNQSDNLAKDGYILIPRDKWEQMAFECGVNPSKIDNIINHWCQPDLITTFLDKQGDEFRLASYYERAHKFLINQGERRLQNSKRGKASVIAKKKGKSKNN